MATRRRITAVHWHVAAADGRRAAALAADLVAELPAGPLRSRALVAQAYQEGSVDELLAISSQAVTEAGDDTEALIDALLMKGLYLMIQGRGAEGYECTKRALGLCDADTPMPLRIQAMTFHGERAQWRGEPEGIRLLVEAAELEGDDLFLDAYRGPNATLGRTLAFADELEEGRRVLEDRRQRALELGDDESRAGLSLHLAELEVKAGRFDVALRLAEECLAIVEGSYAEEAQSAPSYVIALIRGHQGDISLARKIAEDGLARCVAQNDLLFGAIHRATLGFLELSVGDNAAAVEWLSPVVDRFRESRDDPGLPHNARIPDAIEALTALDRLDEAEELLEAWDETGERFDRPRVRASSARCRALIGAARGELEPALERALSAVEQHADLPLPFERARTLIVLGSVQRRVKKKAAARESLEDALQLLDAIGERLWPPRAHAELARISGRAPSGGLTATEERVADLVAGGRSNKEVAAELFVSVRTVEHHVSRIFDKLGVRRRVAAVAAARDLGIL
jgi:ATP/maltotriose-dependent transcriptional regulator MalT